MKNDAISRSDLLDRLNYYISHSMEPGQYAYKVAHREVETAPALDAVPVVRCPACSWRTNSSFCRRHGHYVRDDFFCAYGTTGDVRGCRPAKKNEKKAEERCLATGGPCSRCTPGPCDHRKTVIADDSGQ